MTSEYFGGRSFIGPQFRFEEALRDGWLEVIHIPPTQSTNNEVMVKIIRTTAIQFGIQAYVTVSTLISQSIFCWGLLHSTGFHANSNLLPESYLDFAMPSTTKHCLVESFRSKMSKDSWTVKSKTINISIINVRKSTAFLSLDISTLISRIPSFTYLFLGTTIS